MPLAIAVLAVVAAMAGCRRGPRDFDNENDTLRRQNLELTEENQTIRSERDEALAKLAEVERMASWDGQELASAVRLALPRCAKIDFGVLSGPGDADNLPGFEVVDVYLIPRDGRGRFVQIVGTLTVRVDLLPKVSEEPHRIGSVVLGAEELREAYRSGFTGTHYTVRLAPETPIEAGSGSVALSVEFADALTGRVHQSRAVVKVPDTWR